MSKVVLKTETTVLRSLNNISIFTKYIGDEKTLEAFISELDQVIDFVNIFQGDGVIINKGYNEVNFYLNNMGELIVSGENVERFGIGSDGNLTIDE